MYFVIPFIIGAFIADILLFDGRATKRVFKLLAVLVLLAVLYIFGQVLSQLGTAWIILAIVVGASGVALIVMARRVLARKRSLT